MSYEIITDWSSENSPGGLSVMYTDEFGVVATHRAAIDQLFTDMANKLDTLTSWVVRTSGKVIDPATGTLTGFWSDATAAAGVGTLSGIPVPNASQVLLRWRTDDVANGRLVQGRTFVPGLGTAAMDGGQLSSATLTQFQAAQLTFLTTMGDEFLTWHRPTESTPGAVFTVETGATWEELAVQRRRR